MSGLHEGITHKILTALSLRLLCDSLIILSIADAYTTDQVIYIWKHGYNSIKISAGLKLSQFDLQSQPMSNYTSTNREGNKYDVYQCERQSAFCGLCIS